MSTFTDELAWGTIAASVSGKQPAQRLTISRWLYVVDSAAAFTVCHRKLVFVEIFVICFQLSLMLKVEPAWKYFFWYLFNWPIFSWRSLDVRSALHKSPRRRTFRYCKCKIIYRLNALPVTGCPWSLKVMEFRKTIFQAWKVMENSKGHGKLWKSHGKRW